VLEETHYYPFGLTMAGISSKALKGANYPENRKGYNGNELQSKEFFDGSGLELYDFNARTYDQQTGRFIQIDPWVELGSQEMLTPYQFSYNNPVRYNDPDGKCPLYLVLEIAEVAWEAYTAYKIGKNVWFFCLSIKKGFITVNVIKTSKTEKLNS
jgi:RHS repeat-associated protein